MKRAERSKPVDVSKGLFMDLAFLLIASLVLMINEPSREATDAERQRQQEMSDAVLDRIEKMELRSSVVRDVLEDSTGVGESLFIQITSDGRLLDLPVKGEPIPFSLDHLEKRIIDMSKQGERVVVLFPAKDVPYQVVASVREKLENMRIDNELSRIIEVVQKGSS